MFTVSRVINIVLLVVLVINIGLAIYKIAKKDIADGKGPVDIFLDCIPAIDGGLTDFLTAYKSMTRNDDRIRLAVDFLYDIIAKNTTIDDKFPMLFNKENVEKLILPMFLKAYSTELQE